MQIPSGPNPATVPGQFVSEKTASLGSSSAASLDSSSGNASAARGDVLTRLLAQVLAIRRDGLLQLQSLGDGKITNLQSNQTVQVGQLVLLEVRSSGATKELNLLTQGQALATQILRLLAPHAGNLQSKFAEVTQTTSPQARSTDLVGPGSLPTAKRDSADSLSAGLTKLIHSIGVIPKQLPKGAPIEQGTILQSLKALLSARASTSEQAPRDPSTTTGQVQDTRGLNLTSALPLTTQFIEPARINASLQPGQPPALLKLILPLLRGTLQRAPVTAEQAQTRDAQLSAMTQLAARVLLGALRAPNAGNEAEVSRFETLSRFDQSIDSLQIELNVVKENIRDKESNSDGEGEETQPQVKQWRVRLAFEFPELGLITAFILLRAEQQLEVQFWSERPETRSKLEQYQSRFSDKLEQVLSHHGIKTLEVGVFDGTPPPSRQAITSQLVDETA